ncbi:outer membrane beta-barrel protein [Oceanicoccus sp. KOV_DT_Chl]|uniref:outer membrane beta-barrel protein n=1 Tax=Oceanicoccus sp. KOV_DT_Chl TaxID=1904639 RepID=UPI000C7E549D|nr:outer membrane beta-barrel protein [Oceanicoccus sp. KOV_DT_Chl]
MDKLNRLLLIITAALIVNLGFLSTANADEGYYIGAGLYQADVDISGIDGDDTTTAFFVGYTFLDSNLLMLSAEGGYYDLGDFSEGATKLNAEAFTAAGVAMLPLGPLFEIYAKVGIAYIDVDGRSAFGDLDESGEEVFYGAGASIDILDTIDIYAEYLQFDNDAESEVIGIGVRLAF